MELLERHTQLAELRAALRAAGSGHGALVLVAGEAGAGKTAIVEQFVREHAGGRRVLWGLCDDLLTPRPLGPFRDMAAQVGGELQRISKSGPVAKLLDAMREEMVRPPHPVVAVVEDAHWADAATLDALRFLGRRIGRMRALLIVTFRDDEVPTDHSLRAALGAVPSHHTRRVRLAPLSREAVSRLAGRADVDALYELTGGNPFFVREVLAAPFARVPASVQDAVMARVRRLSTAGHECAEVVAAVPSRSERWLLDGCGVSGVLDEVVRLGVLRVDGDMVSFPHELARRAVEHSLESDRRKQVNTTILEVLAGRHPEPARIVHHAVIADDGATVARFAPLAARRAAAADAHREAADHFRHTLGQRDRFGAAVMAGLLDEYARECLLAGRHPEARSAVLQAAKSHELASDLHRLGASLSLLSDVCWHLGRGGEAEAASSRAIAALEQLPPSRELALAYSQRAKLAMVGSRHGEAIDWGDRAVGLARRLGETEVMVHALITVGNARWMVSPYDESSLVEGLALALDEGLSQAAARAYNNLAAGHTNHGEYSKAARYFGEGLALCETHDLIAAYNVMSAARRRFSRSCRSPRRERNLPGWMAICGQRATSPRAPSSSALITVARGSRSWPSGSIVRVSPTARPPRPAIGQAM